MTFNPLMSNINLDIYSKSEKLSFSPFLIAPPRAKWTLLVEIFTTWFIFCWYH